MNEDKAFLIINAIADKENTEAMQAYVGKIGPVFEKNGGKFIAKYKVTEQLAGEQGPEVMAIAEFPNNEAIKEMVNSEDFKALAELRAKAYSKLNLMISSEM